MSVWQPLRAAGKQHVCMAVPESSMSAWQPLGSAETECHGVACEIFLVVTDFLVRSDKN